MFLLDCQSYVKLARFVWLIQGNALDFIVLGTRLIKWEIKHQFLDWMQQVIFMKEKCTNVCRSIFYVEGRHNHIVEAQDMDITELACGNLGKAL